jgi:hypothetical protein
MEGKFLDLTIFRIFKSYLLIVHLYHTALPCLPLVEGPDSDHNLDAISHAKIVIERL